jgi:DNA-binding GntR family transcriptional regulator
LRILAIVRERIDDGTYSTKIPTSGELAEEMGVAASTVAHALRLLKDDGILVSKRGQGTFINRMAMDSNERMST